MIIMKSIDIPIFSGCVPHFQIWVSPWILNAKNSKKSTVGPVQGHPMVCRSEDTTMREMLNVSPGDVESQCLFYPPFEDGLCQP